MILFFCEFFRKNLQSVFFIDIFLCNMGKKKDSDMKKIVIAGIVLAGLVAVWAMIPSGWEIRNENPSGDEILCFGDSLTYGTGAKEGMAYPSRLSKIIGLPVINLGVPGDTTETALSRLEEDVLSGTPRIVLITLGGNDLKNRISREKAFGNLRKIVEAIQSEGALVVIGGLDFGPFGRGFAGEYERLAKETGSVLVPDVFDGIWGDRDLMSDAIHPNSDGYAIMAEHFYKAIRPYL